MRHVYVYYRVDPVQAEQTAARVDALFAALHAYCRTPPRRMQRCDDSSMWMEVYGDVTDYERFQAAMNEHVDRLGLDALNSGGRHVECFEADAAPA